MDKQKWTRGAMKAAIEIISWGTGVRRESDMGRKVASVISRETRDRELYEALEELLKECPSSLMGTDNPQEYLAAKERAEAVLKAVRGE